MGAPGGSQEKYTSRPLKRRWLRPSSRISTTRHRAGFERGTHSSSPLQGAITRGALHVPQRTRTEDYHRASKKRKKKMSARHAEPRCLGPKPRLCGWKKSGPGRMCRSWGPKNLRRRSEIRKGSLALTAQVRSGRDHSEREHVDHRNGSKHPEKGSGVLFMSKPSQRRPLPCLGQKREALAAAKEGEMVRCIARGPSRRQAPHASFAQSPLVPAQPPGPGVRVQIKPHLGQQAGKGAVRPA
jgi:hypothetical protein